jgi:D-lactate dehydrogenase
MTITVFSTYPFERPYLTAAAQGRFVLTFLDTALTLATAAQAPGSTAVALFVNDDASAPALEKLAVLGMRYLLVRAAGHDNVDLPAARRLGLRVATVPHYSPFAIAEHALALMLTLRHLRQADVQVRRADFRLDHLMGFDLHGKTVGIVGCGTIGGTLTGLLHGFGCRLLGTDVQPDVTLTQCYGLTYVPLDELCAQADVISLHAPLTPTLPVRCRAVGPPQAWDHAHQYGPGRTARYRGGPRDPRSGSARLPRGGRVRARKGLFFNDHSQQPLQDALLARLLAHPNALVTGHQGFLTHDALTNIATTTLETLGCWLTGAPTANELLPQAPAG